MESIGELLLKTRKRKKISLDKAARGTKIKKEYLAALESENFNELPGQIYVQGFLTNYAQYLGIKTEKVLELYKMKKPTIDKKQIKLDYPNFNLRYKRKSYIGLLILLIAVSLIMWQLNRIGKVSPSPTKTEILPEKQSFGPLNVEIKAIKDCWLRIKDGDEIVFEGNLNKDEKRNWRTDKEFELRVSDASGIELKVNDKFIGVIGEEGEFIQALVITPDEIYFDE